MFLDKNCKRRSHTMMVKYPTSRLNFYLEVGLINATGFSILYYIIIYVHTHMYLFYMILDGVYYFCRYIHNNLYSTQLHLIKKKPNYIYMRCLLAYFMMFRNVCVFSFQYAIAGCLIILI